MQGLNPRELQHMIGKLEQEIEEYRTLLDSIPVMLWYKDTSNRILRINQAAANLEGKTIEEVEGKSSYHLYPKEIADAYYQDDLKVIQSGEPELDIIEPHVVPSTGEKFWLQTGKVPYYGNSNTVTGVIAYATDITEREQLREELNDLKAFFKEVIKNVTSGIEEGTDPAEILAYLNSIQNSLDPAE